MQLFTANGIENGAVRYFLWMCENSDYFALQTSVYGYEYDNNITLIPICNVKQYNGLF